MMPSVSFWFDRWRRPEDIEHALVRVLGVGPLELCLREERTGWQGATDYAWRVEHASRPLHDWPLGFRIWSERPPAGYASVFELSLAVSDRLPGGLRVRADSAMMASGLDGLPVVDPESHWDWGHPEPPSLVARPRTVELRPRRPRSIEDEVVWLEAGAHRRRFVLSSPNPKAWLRQAVAAALSVPVREVELEVCEGAQPWQVPSKRYGASLRRAGQGPWSIELEVVDHSLAPLPSQRILALRIAEVLNACVGFTLDGPRPEHLAVVSPSGRAWVELIPREHLLHERLLQSSPPTHGRLNPYQRTSRAEPKLRLEVHLAAQREGPHTDRLQASLDRLRLFELFSTGVPARLWPMGVSFLEAKLAHDPGPCLVEHTRAPEHLLAEGYEETLYFGRAPELERVREALAAALGVGPEWLRVLRAGEVYEVRWGGRAIRPRAELGEPWPFGVDVYGAPPVLAVDVAAKVARALDEAVALPVGTRHLLRVAEPSGALGWATNPHQRCDPSLDWAEPEASLTPDDRARFHIAAPWPALSALTREATERSASGRTADVDGRHALRMRAAALGARLPAQAETRRQLAELGAILRLEELPEMPLTLEPPAERRRRSSTR